MIRQPVVPKPILLDTEAFSSQGAVYTGSVLRRAREARGLTIDEVCARTRISREHVANLEADRYDRLPPAVYVRGELMALAKELRLDGQRVARSYMDAIATAVGAQAR